MMLLVLAAISAVVGAGIYLSLSRDVFRVVIGLTLLGAGVNLVVFTAGRFASTTPPLLDSAEDARAAAAADPLVQALVLTAIVISFALLCLALVLGARLRTVTGSNDTRAMRTSEPPGTDPVKPPELEDE